VRKLSKRILFYVLAIWAVSAAYSTIANTRKAATIRFEEEPGLFEVVWEAISPSSGSRFKSKSAVLIALDSGEILTGKNENKIRPIASLTKLITAMVFMETSPDLSRVETVTSEDRKAAGRTRLYVGEKLTMNDLFSLMLISSDNVAARILARSTGLERDDFIVKMNELAQGMNLKHTRFTDPTGLDSGNVSTALEFARLFKSALEFDLIAEAISRKSYTYRALNGDRQHIAYNTNRLLYGRHDIIGGKTGYIRDSGYCLAIGVEDGTGRRFGAILLGAPSNNYRYRDAHRLLASANN
jgi:D-alanyl-D-alanine endopeptidase (penicillin-binding protein 7)